MELLLKLWNNRVLISAAAGWLFAQTIKIAIEIAKGEFTPARLTEGGGMPSGHASTVTALALSCGLTQGADSAVFVVALFFAVVVIFDATHVRHAAGENGKALNRLNEERRREKKAPLFPGTMPEKLGHTVPEVIAGMAVGIFAAVLFSVWIP